MWCVSVSNRMKCLNVFVTFALMTIDNTFPLSIARNIISHTPYRLFYTQELVMEKTKWKCQWIEMCLMNWRWNHKWKWMVCIVFSLTKRHLVHQNRAHSILRTEVAPKIPYHQIDSFYIFPFPYLLWWQPSLSSSEA